MAASIINVIDALTGAVIPIHAEVWGAAWTTHQTLEINNALVSASNPLPVTLNVGTGAIQTATQSCATGSLQAFPSDSLPRSRIVLVNTDDTTTIWCRWGPVDAVVNGDGCFPIYPHQRIDMAGGPLNTSALQVIATATPRLYWEKYL